MILLLLVMLGSPLLAQEKKYTLVFLHKKPDADHLEKDKLEKLMAGHMANIQRLAKEGKLLAAGPFEGGGGIFIFKSPVIEEVKGWVSSDPGVQAQRWNVEYVPYIPRIGGVCPVGEKYEMVHYQFIRFDAVVSKFNAQDFPQIIQQHNDYVKKLASTGNVVTEAIFSERDGGILIMQGELQKEVVELDPAVQEGLMTVEIKKLFIARGSFCEQ